VQRSWWDLLIAIGGVALAGATVAHWVGTSPHEDLPRQMLRTVGHWLVLADGALLAVAGFAHILDPVDDGLSGTALGFCTLTSSVTGALGMMRWIAAVPRPSLPIVGVPPPTDEDRTGDDETDEEDAEQG
jgi:hypothetical protein